jgi:DNA-binding Lrp family transcriptional regulator
MKKNKWDKLNKEFDEALDLYGTNTIEGKILQMIQDAGENGTTQEDMATALNTSTSVLNPRIKEFETANVFNRSDKNIDTLDVDLPDDEEIEEPEEEEPEETEKEDDFPIEFEPSTADIKSTEKEFGGEYGKKLSPEDEEKYQKIRNGIEKKIKRLADMSSSERAKSLDLQQLKALINKEDIKKLFKDKGVSLKDLVGDIIG